MWNRLRQRIASLVRRPTGRAAIGRRGEREAARLLRRKGYRILERNFTVRQGEVDVVAFHDGVLVFVEVRSRTGPCELDPAVTVTRPKQLRVLKAAQTWCALNAPLPAGSSLRFDVISAVFPPDGRPVLRHYENAFQQSAGSFV
jgi:putative endonuclease